MTTRTILRDAKAQSAIESVLAANMATLSPESIFVTARDNHSGEPALYVYVVVPSAKEIPAEPEQNRLVLDMIDALEQIDDSRFPYLHFASVNMDEGGWSDPARPGKVA